jgi:hypothetical protein
MKAAGKSATKKAPSELEIQTLFRSRARIQCPAVAIVAVPNAAKRGQRAMNQARREGAAWGFPDLIALAPGKIAFLEMKAEKGLLSERQSEWQDRLHRMGFPCGVFRDPDDALAFLRRNGFPFFEAQV